MNWDSFKRFANTYPRVFVCLFSLLFSLLAFVATRNLHKTIATDYEPQVQNLLDGKGLIFPSGKVMDRYPPLYPVSLASLRIVSTALGLNEPLLLFAFAAACLALASICTYNIASMVIGSDRAGIAAILFAIHPQVLFGVVVPLSETPFLAVLNCAVWAFLYALTRKRPGSSKLMLVAGLLVGAAMLLRPAAMFIPLLLAAVVLLSNVAPLRRRLQWAFLLLLGVSIALLPWELYDWNHSGRLILLSTGGVPTLRDGFSFNNKTMRSHIWIPSGAQAVVDDVWQEYNHLTGYVSIANLMTGEIAKHPFGVAELYAFKALRSWYGTDSQRGSVELLNAIVSALYLLAGILGMRNYFRQGPDRKNMTPAALLVVLILYCWAMTTLALSIVRYMVPALAFVCTFAPLSLRSVVPKTAKKITGERSSVEEAVTVATPAAASVAIKSR